MRLSKKIFLLHLLFFFGINIYAQQGITTSKGFSAQQLVKDIFLKSGCKNVYNINPINNGLSLGYFQDDSFIFGFGEGVIISSGDVELAEGPNGELESTFAYAQQSDDPDLNVFAPGSIFDVGGIEFDFVPVGNKVTFEYAFGSEEYCEFVGSEFNDVFGFFVSGPGINGPFSNNAINVALVPGTNDFVAINSINHVTNSNLYIKNELFEETDECDIPFDPAYPEEIEYDGMTEQLTATIDVIPCETYHIRLLVADVGDDILDSGVFLGAKTFDLSGDVRITPRSVGSNEPVAVEGCRNGEFLIERLGGGNQDEVVYFNISANSTATSGIDYIPFPDSIIIPAGQNGVVLTVEILDDLIAEPDETIIIEITYPCDCIEPLSETLFIRDKLPFETTPAEVQVCANEEFSMTPNLMNGLSPFTYLWENGSTTNSISATVQTNTDFYVTVTDFCNDTIVALINAIIQPRPEAFISGDSILCNGVDQFLEINMGGSPPWAFQYILNGVVEDVVQNTFENPYLLPVSEIGIYELGIFTDGNCTGIASGQVVVTEAEGIVYETTPTSCFDENDGTITWSLANGNTPINIFWSPSVNNNLMPTDLSAGEYNLIAIDGNGCEYEAFINIPVEPNLNSNCQPYNLYIPNSFSPNDDGANDDFRLYVPPINNINLIKSIQIFNRWGGLVFKLSDFIPSSTMPLWDGIFKGKEMDGGVYAWQIILLLENEEEVVLSGDVVLIK